MINLKIADGIIIACCLLIVFVVALISTNKKSNHSNFILADRNTPWWAVAGSIFAANIGNEHFVGQAGSACKSGFVIALFEWIGASLVFLLGLSCEYVCSSRFFHIGLSFFPNGMFPKWIFQTWIQNY